MTPFALQWRTTLLSASGPKSGRGPAYAQRLVAAALAEHLDGQDVCYPSERRLADCTTLTRRRVHQALLDLVAGGWLTSRPTGRRGRYGSPIVAYAIAMPPLNGAHTTPMDAEANGVAAAPLNGAHTAPIGRCTNGAISPGNGAISNANGAGAAPEPVNLKEEERASPASWELTLERRAEAERLAPALNAAFEWDQFRDWHARDGKPVADIDAGWRFWLRRSAQYAAAKQPASGPRYGRQSTEEEERAARLECVRKNAETLERVAGGRRVVKAFRG